MINLNIIINWRKNGIDLKNILRYSKYPIAVIFAGIDAGLIIL